VSRTRLVYYCLSTSAWLTGNTEVVPRRSKRARGPPFAFFPLTNVHDWMIPLLYVNPEELVQLFRVADPFALKGSGV
jgi:hypothetical protein